MSCRPRRPVDPGESFSTLAAALWDVRAALELVLFRLVEEQLVLDSPSRRWLARTDDDLRGALGALDSAEAARNDAVAEALAALDLAATTTLAELTGTAPEPWSTILADHRLALRVLVRDIDEQVQTVGAQMRLSARAVRQTLDDLRGTLAEPLAEFRTTERTLLVAAAESTHRGALGTVARVPHPELARFVS